jgi:hypothetical protein
MAKWYGQDILDKMTAEGFVVDHMNNESFDCQISNLSFLSSDENKAKGFTVDKQSNELRWNLALNMFKDFETGCYQMTIFFNKTMHFENVDTNERYPVSALKLLYDTNYEIVINDARYIMLSYKDAGRFQLNRLNHIELKIEKAQFIFLNEQEKDRAFVEIDGQHFLLINDHTRVVKVNFEKGWKPNSEEK